MVEYESAKAFDTDGKAASQSIKAHRQNYGYSTYARPYMIENQKRAYVYRFFKRLTDILCSLLAIVVLAPFMLVIAFLVVRDDPEGGPIFKQRRIGLRGREFTFYKFRSMYVDAEDMLDDLMEQNEVQGKAFKIKKDPRITKLGKTLRNYSIDELPQLFNVLKGDMSIVGPRPPLPNEVEKYDEYEQQRLATRPGLTCFWQVHPTRHDVHFDEWVAMDIQYAKEQCYLLDWKLIFRTVGLLFKGNAD